jgi:hypothetical protein
VFVAKIRVNESFVKQDEIVDELIQGPLPFLSVREIPPYETAALKLIEPLGQGP